jgi:uncharacterized Tic20 family protein
MSDPTQGNGEDRPPAPPSSTPEPPPAYGSPPPSYGSAPDPGPPPPPPGQPGWNAPPGGQPGVPPGPPPQGWSGPPQTPYGAGPQYGGVRPLSDAEARQTAGLAHYLGLAGLIGFGWLGPLIIWLTKKDSHPFINDQGREALNFNITITGIVIISSFLSFLLFPILLIIAALIVNVVFSIIAGQRASAGEPYRYPFSVRLIN